MFLTNRMTKEEFEQFVLEHKVTWDQLQKVVMRVNHATEDIFDPETSIKDEPPFKSEWERENLSMQRSLRKLHLLKIPLHYDKYGKVYIVRQECGDFLFEEHKEKFLKELNDTYYKWMQARSNSKNKQLLEQEYTSAIKRAAITMPEEYWWNNTNQRFEFVKDDNARWLDSI